MTKSSCDSINDSWVPCIDDVARCNCSACLEHDNIMEGHRQYFDGEGSHGGK